MRDNIERALRACLPSERSEPKMLRRAMRYSVLSGGKRIRPAIAIEACRACGGRVRNVMPIACAIEFVHTYSLIHDDLPVMDDDDYRRGKPSCHKAFGEAAAILAGDALLTLAFNILARIPVSEIAARASLELSKAIGAGGMVGGQALDLEPGHEIGRVNDLKTAKLFEVSAKLGAIAAGAGRKETDAMARYGLYFGRAFQVADDIADGAVYLKASGAPRAKRDVLRMIKESKKGLVVFGSKANGLKRIADGLIKNYGATDR